MSRFNNISLVAIFEHDAVTNALSGTTAALAYPPKVGTGYPITTVAAYTGPKTLFITDIMVSFGDIVVTDPTADRYLGWAVFSATDFTATPTYASVKGYTANADLPHIHDNSVSTTAIQAVVNAPVSLFSYVGAGGDTIYAKRANEPTTAKRAPIRIAAHSLFQIRLGTYMNGTLAAVTGLDDVTILAYGFNA